jgi:antitoxin ParD1/3/4
MNGSPLVVVVRRRVNADLSTARYGFGQDDRVSGHLDGQEVVIFATRGVAMPHIQKVSVALTGEQISALKAAVETGEYATTSEAVRDALREWQWKRELRGEDLNRLREMWRVGKASGVAVPLDLKEVRQEARRRLKKATGQRA